jgi:hypothetical protein
LLANAVNAALEMGHASLEALEELKEEMNSFATKLKEFSVEAKVTSESILEMIGLLRSRAHARNDNVKARLAQLESIVNKINCPASPPTVQQRFFQASLGGDTLLGTAFVGGTETTLTANMLFDLVQELQAKVDLLAKQAKNTGVIFNDVAFNSELEYSVWLAKHNPSRMGFAAMVDFDSIWAFADSELQDSSSWINDTEKSRKIGFKGGKINVIYMHSMGQKYPPVIVGKEKNITSTTTIKMLESFEHWQGNGMGDGYKASLMKTLPMAVDQHHAYCMDHVPAGIICNMALQTAEATMRFWHALVAYLDDKYSMLTSFNLLPKHILLLLSNKVI